MDTSAKGTAVSAYGLKTRLVCSGIDKRKNLTMIELVVVADSKSRPFKSIPGPGISGVPLPGIELKRLFCCPSDIRTPHVVGAASGAARKKTATRYAKARGQFPNNPCGWSNHQAEGHTVGIRSMMILHCRGEAPSLSTLQWGRGVFG